MHKIWRYIPKGLRDRPFDAYTAIALIVIGIYGLVNPYFPESHTPAISALLIHIIELYFILASIVMLCALSCKPKDHPSFYFFGQMYSWAVISVTGILVMILQLMMHFNSADDYCSFPYWIIFFVFGCTSFAAFIRSFDMWSYVKEVKGNES